MTRKSKRAITKAMLLLAAVVVPFLHLPKHSPSTLMPLLQLSNNLLHKHTNQLLSLNHNSLMDNPPNNPQLHNLNPTNNPLSSLQLPSLNHHMDNPLHNCLMPLSNNNLHQSLLTTSVATALMASMARLAPTSSMFVPLVKQPNWIAPLDFGTIRTPMNVDTRT